jgi:hypothetical protein
MSRPPAPGADSRSGSGSGRQDRSGWLRVSRQEACLVVDRLLMAAGVPLGNVVAVREFILDAECVIGGALRCLRNDAAALRADARLPGLPYRRTDPSMVEADGRGRSSLLIGPDVADLAGGAARHSGAVIVRVTSVRDPAFLQTLAVTQAVPGATIGVRTGPAPPGTDPAVAADGRAGTCTLTCCRSPRDGDGGGGGGVKRHLRAATSGLQVRSDLWEWLCREAAEALTPDSAASRRHAGRLEPGPSSARHGG